jgi:hypothetical protein
VSPEKKKKEKNALFWGFDKNVPGWKLCARRWVQAEIV